MGDDKTARLALPLLQPGQAQKELDHNEALAILDIAVQAVVQAADIDTPPSDPLEGACWIVGSAPIGAWSGQSGSMAGWSGSGWRFVRPQQGLTAWSIADQTVVRYDADGWRTGDLRARRLLIDGVQVIGPRGSAIGAPAGGTTVDVEARAALAAILMAMRMHGLIDP